MNNNEKVNQKRTLQSTFVLLAIMLSTSARDAGEKEFTEIAKAMFGLNNPAINANIDELIQQGYVEEDDHGLRCTKFGEKIALSSTHNTPNFARLAEGNTNTAFAMLFAAYAALRDRHLVNQDKIVAGKAGDTLATNLRDLVRFFSDRITPVVAAVFEKKPAVKKSKKEEVTPILEEAEV